LTLSFNWPWSNISIAHWLILADICAYHQWFKRYRADTKVWRTDRLTDGGTDGRSDGRTDRRTDRQTVNGAENNMSPHFMGGDIMIEKTSGILIKSPCQTLILWRDYNNTYFKKGIFKRKYKSLIVPTANCHVHRVCRSQLSSIWA